MENVLLVPILLEALPVGEKTSKFADMEPNFWQMDLVPIGVNITNSLFSEKALPSGIHLHWTMPDALLHGKEANGNLLFPPLPDRYILHRLWEKEGTVKRRSFLIKSNFCSNENGKTCEKMDKQTLPVFQLTDGLWQGAGKGGKKYAFAGGGLDLDQIEQEQGFLLDEVTAIGMGDPVFSAFYLQSKTVFGFYDSCSDVKEGNLTYCLTGYYDRPEQDPLRGTDEEIKKLQWKWMETADLPKQILCHGMVQSVMWKGPDFPYESGVPKKDPEIYIGNNSDEAMAAYMKDHTGKRVGSERLLQAMQSDLLMQAKNAANPDSYIELEENLHQLQFEVKNGGIQWHIREEDEKRENFKGRGLSSNLWELLSDLNTYQSKYDRIQFEVEDLKEEGYGCWCKYLYQNTPSPFNSLKEDGYLIQIRGIMKEIQQGLNSMEDLSKSLVEKKEKMEENLKNSGYRLVQEEKRFYAPEPPAILLSGIGRVKKQGFQKDKDGYLPCRRKPVSSLLIPIDGKEIEVAGKEVLEWNCPLEAKAFQGVEELLYEALLLSSDFSLALAQIALKKAGIIYPNKKITALVEKIKQFQKEEDKVTGELPYEIANRTFKAPWSPLLMQWRVQITLNQNSEQVESIINHYQLQEIDYEYRQDSGSGTNIMELYGSTILSPHAAIQAGYRIKKMAEQCGTSNIDTLSKVVAEEDILSQQIDGFTEGHILKEKSLYVPICRDENIPEDLIKEMNQYLVQTSVVPNKYGTFDHFQPIRSGMMEIKDLWVVDSFGQIKKIDVSKEHVHISEVMQHEGAEGKAFLRPRFFQPCRMDIEWLPRNERDPNPVFGFLQPNFLDKNLQLYNGKGVYLGIVQRTKMGTRWITGQINNKNLRDESPHLQEFRDSLLKLSSAEYQNFLDDLDEGFGHMSTIDGGSFENLCFGKVIALTRLRIQMMQRGKLLKAEQKNGNFSSKGYENNQFSIRIGDTRKVRDGLFGFFLGEDAKEAYTGFPFQKSGEILSASLNMTPLEMTVLMDPTGQITISSGLLPVRKIQLEAQDYQEQLRNMEVCLNIAPIISYSGVLTIPTPREGKEHDTWKFLYLDHDREWKELKNLEEPPALLQDKTMEIWEGYLQWQF